MTMYGSARRMAAVALVSVCSAALPAMAQTEPAVSDADRTMARAILEEAIAVPTAKGRGQVPVLAEKFAKRLREAGFRADEIEMLPIEIEGEKTVGLVVRYAGRNPLAKPIAFLGHMDVVDALKENWATDPYVPVEKDGYIYGRGSTDNKAGVTALVASFIRLKKSGFVPQRDLLLAFSGDEETGMQTTRLLIQHPLVARAEYALNSDAGGGTVTTEGKYDFNIQAAEKTNASFAISATNAGGHSSAPRPDNAIYDLADAIKKVQALRFPVEFNQITRIMVADLAAEKGGALGAALTALLANPADAAARAEVEKYPQYSNLLQTTCVGTMLQAGNAPNALPQNATLTVNCRIFPGTPVAAVQAKLVEAIGNDKIRLSLIGEAVESPVSPVNPALFATLQRAVRRVYPGVTLKPSMSSGGTDGREFRKRGIPTYGAGALPLRMPEDSRAHGTDERVPIAAYLRQLDYWDGLLRDLGSRAK
ncbi:M20/M25/M40 family metallo-hydrolase [Sphingomonas sp. IC-56]|uniref:M20/M25/M40 family metallo-hydrolase n=1 Tax=Sphingomonas sp. IC-56 TaxID=2898529 RepID=UPI001E3A4FDB|nr:M20/M25/M40 family metallo-hydrolase [Sphingomonas sp. IC-56]MCD2323328.1 M20/M25/M40 family metallo-hydrolase [Sphingomonas sp. IC-56]